MKVSSFLKIRRNGAEQSGIWIGLKDPDERVQQLLDLLQPKVDAGEILAEPIYIFRSPHTEKELYELQDEVAAALKEMDSQTRFLRIIRQHHYRRN